VSAREIDTPQGPARAHVQPASGAVATLVLGHGAGGSVSAPDLMVTTREALGQSFNVVLVEQPYLVAGRRSPPRAPRLDEAWIAVLDDLRDDVTGGLPLVTGGRSSGARVACRTADAVGAAAVLCLAFPLVPPARKAATAAPQQDRQAELDAVHVPMLIVQGQNDRFGMPAPAGSREVAVVRGDHALKGDLQAVGAAVRDWLPRALRG
jgi:predicted alpha/beta-hydrolase family hydrolase